MDWPSSSITPKDLECMLCDETTKPKALPLSLLAEITNGFSDEQKIGSGGFAVVYKGTLENRTVAVKRMSDAYMDEKVFQREVECLMMVKHKNVVRFLGYCADRQGSMEMYDGKFVMADVNQRLLCFEYLSKGSLDNYITDTSSGLRWTKRYQIITGICQGLHYLHQNKIVHLDLKPANILLDDSWVPKITDFGISRRFDERQSRVITKMVGTFGYLAPESIRRTKVKYAHSYRLDIYSLGVVITEILTGEKGYYDVGDVVESWVNMLDKSQSDVQLEQVRVCAEIGIECTKYNPAERPDTKVIIKRLNGYIESGVITSQHVEDALDELHQDTPNAAGPSSSKVVESWSNMLEKPQSGVQMKQSGSKPSLRLEYLKYITNNFCDERILGKCSSGVVYKGLLDNGEMVAVKKLIHTISSSQEQFENEVNLRMDLNHQNIVRLVGYCYETQHILTTYKRKSVFAWNTESLLCLEFLPNGSLDKYISDASSGFDWRTRCKVIVGISYGLQYLHEHSNEPIIHLDLKPSHILLDANMLPKITNFGLSRLFDQNQTIHTATTSGTLGYMSPESLRGIITPMSDIFSLGVIIMEVITGHRDYPYDIRKYSEDFIELELPKWRNRLQIEPGYTSLEADCQQIERCIQIGLICVNPERTRRPNMKKIIDMLEGSESMDWYISNELSSHGI